MGRRGWGVWPSNADKEWPPENFENGFRKSRAIHSPVGLCRMCTQRVQQNANWSCGVIF